MQFLSPRCLETQQIRAMSFTPTPGEEAELPQLMEIKVKSYSSFLMDTL
jgi:hypothetical protein